MGRANTAAYRERCFKAGNCCACGKTNDLHPDPRCSRCKAKRALEHKALVEAGLCTKCPARNRRLAEEGAQICNECSRITATETHCYCGQPRMAPGQQCDAHYQQGKAGRAERNARRKEAGLCHKCPDGKNSQLSHPDADSCPGCVCKSAAGKWLNDRARWPELLAIFDAQEGLCGLSSKPIFLGLNAHLDHKFPRALGGTNELSNLWWLSKPVNRGKDAELVQDYLDTCYGVVLTDTLAKIAKDWLD